MANGVNKVIVIGNLARDAELAYVGENTPKATFRVLATTRRGKSEHTEGFNCVMWGKRAEKVAPYLTKGKRVYVEGELRTRAYEDEDGEKRYFTEVYVRDLVFQPQPRTQAEPSEPAPEPEEAQERMK